MAISITSYEEFYGIINNELQDKDFDSNNIKDEEIKKIVVLALSLLQDFYLHVQYYTEYDVLTEDFERKLSELNIELKESISRLFDDYVNSLHLEYDVEYKLPSDDIVKSSFDLNNVLDSGVDRVTNQLRDDITNKAHFYRDVAITAGMFSLHADFRRAVKQLSSVIDNNAQYTRNRVEREYLEFVYGQEALFQWVTAGRNTCAWCYEVEAMGAMPLSYFPVDHPNGHCSLKPVYPDDYSYEYQKVLGLI